jgi:hypothetical protein
MPVRSSKLSQSKAEAFQVKEHELLVEQWRAE